MCKCWVQIKVVVAVVAVVVAYGIIHFTAADLIQPKSFVLVSFTIEKKVPRRYGMVCIQEAQFTL